MQEFLVRGNVAHRSAVVNETDKTLFIHDAAQRHPSPLEKIHLLPVHARRYMVIVGQTDEGDAFILPIALKRLRVVRTHRKNLGAATRELTVPVSQARQRRAAVRSHKSAQKI